MRSMSGAVEALRASCIRWLLLRAWVTWHDLMLARAGESTTARESGTTFMCAYMCVRMCPRRTITAVGIPSELAGVSGG